MPRIPSRPAVLSETSYSILNGIRNTIGGEFRELTPLVQDAESLRAYGDVVMGGGQWYNSYVGLIGKIAMQVLLHYAYENPLKLLKRGVLEIGESVEIDWVRLTMPEGYTQSVANPGDVFKTNNPDILFTWHPLNSMIFYETTVNENEIRLCFTSENGVQDLISVIIQRLYDSSEWDEQILMQYLLARAYLDNKTKLAVEIPSVTKSNADDIVIAQKKVSNAMRFMNSNFNIANEPSHTPVDNQVFLISSDMSAVVDVGSLAKAFNLEYNKFIGQSIMVDSFSFDTAKLERLNHIMNITKEQGLVPNFTPFTDEELASLEMVQGAIMDKNFLVIYDRLVEMRDAVDVRHLNINYYFHLWKIFSYNVFAQCRFFTTENLIDPVTVQPEAGTTEVYGALVSTLQDKVKVRGNKISGELNFIEGGLAQSGPLAGDGHFLALKFSNIDTRATSVKIGLNPSAGSGMQELLGDPDMNAVMKISNNLQEFVVVSTDGTTTTTQTFDLTGLVLKPQSN